MKRREIDGGVRETQLSETRLFLYARFLLHLFGGGLGNLHESKFEASQHFNEEILIGFSEITYCFFAEHIEHIDDFASALEIEKCLAGSGIGHSAKHCRRVSSEKIDQHLK